MALTREGTRLEHRTAAVKQDGTARAQPGAAGRAEQERRVPQKPRRLRARGLRSLTLLAVRGAPYRGARPMA